MDRKRLSAIGVVAIPFLSNVLANALYDVLKANVGTVADVLRSSWFPVVVFALLAALWLMYWVVRPAWRGRNAQPPAPAVAEAEVAAGDGRVFDPAIHITDAIEAQITRGPGNPGVNEINWRTQGQMERHIHIAFRPRVLRFFEPTDQIVARGRPTGCDPNRKRSHNDQALL
jgi:hypothetical protein